MLKYLSGALCGGLLFGIGTAIWFHDSQDAGGMGVLLGAATIFLVCVELYSQDHE